jgi:hypothetical protein
MNPIGIIDAFWLQVPPTTGGGISGESTIVGRAWASAYHHYVAPVSREPIEQRFASLAATWRADRAVSSSFSEMVLQPSYQRIIGLGPRVVPSILAELAQKPDHWFWALTAITGDNPVRDDDAGDIGAMTNAWLLWGKKQGVMA